MVSVIFIHDTAVEWDSDSRRSTSAIFSGAPPPSTQRLRALAHMIHMGTLTSAVIHPICRTHLCMLRARAASTHDAHTRPHDLSQTTARIPLPQAYNARTLTHTYFTCTHDRLSLIQSTPHTLHAPDTHAPTDTLTRTTHTHNDLPQTCAIAWHTAGRSATSAAWITARPATWFGNGIITRTHIHKHILMVIHSVDTAHLSMSRHTHTHPPLH